MLSLPGGWDGALAPYLSRWIVVEPATARWQRRAYFALRHAVFTVEQGMFEHGDRDHHDMHAVHLVAMAHEAGVSQEVVGVVRIYRADDDAWYGGRLAVAAAYRQRREVGAALIQAAVGAGRAYGAQRFMATVQSDNVGYFERNHFVAREPLCLHGRPHMLMEADLSKFSLPAWTERTTRRAA